MTGDGVLLNGVGDEADGTDSPLVAADESERKQVTIDGPNLITEKMSVFMVRW